jgi:HEAT repeat protein
VAFRHDEKTLMTRPLFVMVVLIAGVPPLAAQEEEPVLGKKSSEWLATLKNDKELKRRQASLIALEVFGPRTRGVVPGLIEALARDPEAELRRGVALLLGSMGGDAKEAVPHLCEALKMDKADVVREAAALALAGKLNEFAHEQVLVLAGALKDGHAGTRAAAAEALKNLGDKAAPALPQLLDIARNGKSDRLLRLYAIQIVSRLQEDADVKSKLLMGILEEPAAHATLKIAAMEGLARADKLAAAEVEALGRLLKAPSADLRRAAARALAGHGEQAGPVWAQVQAGLRDDDITVRYQLMRVAGALAGEHKEAIPALTSAALQDAHVENRLAAIQELGQLGPTAAAAGETLRKIAAGDARASIREAAAAALKRIEGS